MQSKTSRINWDWSKLLAFDQVKTPAASKEGRSLKSPGMTMFGSKGGLRRAS